MLAEDIAEIARNIYELFNDHDFDSVLEYGAEVELYA
jgi:hypothetical protein